MTEAFKNPLPGVPDVESPFFDKLFAAKGADAETLRIARDVRDKGYALFDFPDPQIFDRIARIRKKLNKHFDLKAWRDGKLGKGKSLRVQDAWMFDADVKAIAGNAEIMRLLADLYGRQAFPFQTLNFPVGTEQDAHTDSVHFSSAPERFMCGVWLAFEDIDADNGPLEYYPGSHKLPIYVNEHLGHCSAAQAEPTSHYSDFVRLWRELVNVHGLERETLTAKKGQALIWSANLLHGGAPQADRERTRWSQVTHYYFEDCTYYTPLMSDPMHGEVFYRDLVDVRDGGKVANAYCGRPVPQEVIARSAPLPAEQRYSELPADFDPKAYLEANPDVRDAGTDPAKHYVVFGARENRKLRP